MIKNSTIIALITIFFTSICAGKTYLGLSVGNLDSVDDPVYNVQFGTYFGESQSFAGEYELLFADVDQLSKIYSAIINLKTHYKFNDLISLYIGGGAGGSRFRGNIDDTVFTFQGLAGVNIGFSEQTSLKIGFRRLYFYQVDSYYNVYESAFEGGFIFKF